MLRSKLPPRKWLCRMNTPLDNYVKFIFPVAHVELKGFDGGSLITQARMSLFSSSKRYFRSWSGVSLLLPHHPRGVNGLGRDSKHFTSAAWMGTSSSRHETFGTQAQTRRSCFALREKLVLVFPLGVQSHKTLPLPAGCLSPKGRDVTNSMRKHLEGGQPPEQGALS